MKRARHSTAGMGLSPILENYLEVIADLSRERGSARAKDVAEAVGVAPPSVTEILKRLVRRGMIEHGRYERIRLTEDGVVAARAIRARHEALVRFLREVLAVGRETAERDACRMEHVISAQTMEAMRKVVEAVKRSGRRRPAWLAALRGSLAGARTGKLGKRGARHGGSSGAGKASRGLSGGPPHRHA
ncbi:MAG: metal-dependent transcriptional regulator [Planctomycetota bacterium]